MSLAQNKARLRWACRRGMLELDVLLISFVDNAFDHLDEQHKMDFERLLACEDPELFAWFMGHKKCEDQALNNIVRIIVNTNKL